MKAEEFLEKYGYPESDQGDGYILTVSELSDLLNEFAENKNKDLIEENKRLRNKLPQRHDDTSDTSFGSFDKFINK